jgi:hypothetical protein
MTRGVLVVVAGIALRACVVAGAEPVAEPLVQVLTSVARNQKLERWEANAKDVTPASPTQWSIKKQTLRGGKQEGVDVITIDNGKMQIAVCPTRGMGILWAKLGDVRLGWDSPVRETVHPQYVNLQARGGLGWLEGFNEFMCRCGMEWAGHPGTDRFVNNVGDEATMELTLHGRVANLPASEVEVLVERQPPYRLRVRGRIDERMFYGPKLELWTELSTEPGSSAFRISDALTNRGAAGQEFQLIYHSNFGKPLLGEGARFVGAAERVTPFNAHAARGLADYAKYQAPTPGFIEQVYKIRPASDAAGRSMGVLVNAKGDRAASVGFSVKELPYLTLWKNTNAEGEGYVTGIEPGTGFPHNRRIERQAGRVPKLAAGESRSFTVDFAIHVGEPEVNAAVDRVALIQAGREPQVDAEPEKID